MSDRGEPGTAGWDRGWDEHKVAQLRRLSRLSLAEKLRWLEEAQGLARRLTDRRSPDAVHEPGPPAGEERTDDDAQH